MACNYAPLTVREKEELRNQPNVRFIVAWANRLGILGHPEVIQQIERKSLEVSKLFFYL